MLVEMYEPTDTGWVCQLVVLGRVVGVGSGVDKAAAYAAADRDFVRRNGRRREREPGWTATPTPRRP